MMGTPLTLRRLAGVLSLGFSLGAIAPSARALDIPLTVQEVLPNAVTGLDRVAEPVSVGIPLDSLSGITSVSQLGLAGVPAGQFRELARWPNGNLKWVLADFEANVPAGGANTTVSIVNGSGAFGGANLATDNGTSITVSTGAAVFTIQKSPFRLLDGVSVGGTNLVNAGADGVAVIDPSGVRYTSANDPSASVTLEENGPVRAVVLASGSLRSALGARLCDYRVRLHFYSAKSYVRAWVSIRNAQASSPAPFAFNSAEVNLKLTLGSGTGFSTQTSLDSSPISDTLASGETAYLYQAYSTKYGWYENTPGAAAYATAPIAPGAVGIDLEKVGVKVYHPFSGTSSDYADGWFAVEDASGKGVTMVMPWMAQLWPAGFEASGDGTTSVQLFSKRNSLTGLAFAWGAYETREILFDFHSSTPASRNTALYEAQYPLSARAPLSQYNAAGAIYHENHLVSEAEQTAWFTNHGSTSPSLANIEPGLWRNHGWSTGGGGNQTDFALLNLIDWIRTGRGGFLADGLRNSLYKADTSVRHSDGFDYSLNEITPPNAGAYNDDVFDFAHCHWLSIPVSYYLTGNELYKEAAFDYSEWKHAMATGTVHYYYPLVNLGDGDERIWSRYLRDFGVAWDFTRDPRYWSDAGQMMDLLLNSSDVPGSWNPMGRNKDRGYIWMPHGGVAANRPISDFFNVQIHYEAVYYIWMLMREISDPRVKATGDYMLGLADFFYNEMYFDQGPSYGQHGYLYDYFLDLTNNSSTNPANFPPQSTFRPISTARAMSYAYEMTGDTKYLDRQAAILPGDIVYVSPRTPSDVPTQACMWDDLYRPVTGWYNIPGVSVTSLGGGSYQLSWTVPAGTTAYRIKYANRTIVDWLGFDQSSRTYAFPPASNIAWFAATESSNPPVPGPGGTVQSVTISGLDPSVIWHFGVRYTTTIADTTPPARVGDLRAR